MTLSWSAARVIKASHELSLGQKVVWLEILSLDQGPDRCFVSGPRLAQRLGMGLDNLERLRAALKADGLLSSQGGGRRGAASWPELPETCTPQKRSPTDADVLALAQQLDDLLRSRRQTALGNGGGTSAVPPSERPDKSPPFRGKNGANRPVLRPRPVARRLFAAGGR